MKGKQIITTLCAFVFSLPLFCQQHTITGKVIGSQTKEPIEYAIITLPDHNLWAVSAENGTFTIEGIPEGNVTIAATCLGYEKKEYTIDLRKDVDDFTIRLAEDNLALSEVVITAQRKKDEATTVYEIDKKAIDHLQALDILETSALLPGGVTSKTNHLATEDENRFFLRSRSGEQGTADFGTAIEIDGVRLSNNATMLKDPSSTMDKGANLTMAKGAGARNLSVSNIESVEIITGIPSVEYGDLTNGMVKLNTVQGKSPLTIEFVTKPHTKQYAAGKGFGLGANNGTVNLHLEHTQSISDLASPYTTYKRNIASVSYNNTFNRSSKHPVIFKAGVTGTLGGYNSEKDPDLYNDTYTKVKDNAVRGNVSINWLLNKPWITNVEASSSISYNDKSREESRYKSKALDSYTNALHGTTQGYFVGSLTDPYADFFLFPGGTWYEIEHNDNKPFNYNARVKANWTKKIGTTSNKILLGADFNSTGNKGKATYFEDVYTTPSWRPYPYSDLPNMNTLSYYLENRLTVPFNKTSLQLTAGIRSDMTFINGSEYGTISSLSPRLNMKYTIPFKRSFAVRQIALRAGVGRASKLPSFDVLYPQPQYEDEQVFSVKNQNEEPYTVYYTTPSTMIYNANLKYQTDHLQEYGIDVKTKAFDFSLSFFNNKTVDPYLSDAVYIPYTFHYTEDPGNNFIIPAEDREYAFDYRNGTVIVSDKTGANSPQTLPYTEKNKFKSSYSRKNGSPIYRRGLEWIVDIAPIQSIRTSIRLDGKFYYYKGVEESLLAKYPTSTSADGRGPYQYIAYYVGNTGGTFNGFETKTLNSNVTFTTHVPAIKLLFSLRIESCLYSYRQNLSEYNGQQYAFVLDGKDDYTPSETKHDIYAGDQYIGVYPLYYTSHDDMNTMIPFKESFLWAKDNDPALYRELARMVKRTGDFNYTFNKQTVSPYFSANISVTKEIGRYVSLTFNAKNFLNNFAKVKLSQTGQEASLYNNSNYLPSFYYGLSLRIKI